MKEVNPIKEKSKVFAVRIIKLYKHLCSTKQEYVISKQLLRSGTSTGANIAEALCGISKKIFSLKCILLLKSVQKHNTGLKF